MVYLESGIVITSCIVRKREVKKSKEENQDVPSKPDIIQEYENLSVQAIVGVFYHKFIYIVEKYKKAS